MKLSNLTFIVTDECNFNCSYCLQVKEKKRITPAIINNAVEFFYPHLESTGNSGIQVGFYGGEPLLAYDLVKLAVTLFEKKNRNQKKDIVYVLTTNGSLLDPEKLAFFERFPFNLVLSYDGLAQDKNRKPGSGAQMKNILKEIQHYPGIDYEVNSVFTPGTINLLSASMRALIEQGVGNGVTFNLSSHEEWQAHHLEVLREELNKLVDFLVEYYREKGMVPVKNFQPYLPTTNAMAVGFPGDPAPTPGNMVFRCSAGTGRMAVTPEGKVWGCYLFHDYFKSKENSPQAVDFSFGMLDDFIAAFSSVPNNSPTSSTALYPAQYVKILENYAELQQDYFQVEQQKGQMRKRQFCFLCPDIHDCQVCPVYAAFSTGSVGVIQCNQCRFTHLIHESAATFTRNILNLQVAA